MDVFSHGLWAAALAKFINFKKRQKINVWLTAFWGVLPDVFSFAPVFIWLGYQWLFGSFDFSVLKNPEHMEPSSADTLPIFQLTNFLYNLTHSFTGFVMGFMIMWLIWQRPRYSVFGWLIHILIDVPSHSYKFYPTPAFWPFSAWKFDGFSWANPWFILVNYAALAIVWGAFLLREKLNFSLFQREVRRD
jgi:hypothetical protein